MTVACYNGAMGKIDEVKEILNTLRIAMSVIIGIIVVLIGGMVARYDDGKIDVIFWSGIVFALILILIVLIIVVKLAKYTKEIRDL